MSTDTLISGMDKLAAEERARRRLAGEESQPTDGGDNKEQPWPKPDMGVLKPRTIDAPAFSAFMFGPTWSRWIADAAESKGAPPDYVALPLLAIAGSLLGNVRRGSPWKGWTEPPVIWVAPVGNPSSGKSPGLDAIMDPLRALESELDFDFADRRAAWVMKKAEVAAARTVWQAQVAAATKKGAALPPPPAETEDPDPPSRHRLHTSDATIEGLVRVASVNHRGVLLQRDELAGWLGNLDRYGGSGGDRAAYLEGYGGRPFTVDRVKATEPIRVPFFSISIVGGIQPDKLARMLASGDDDGLAARFIYAWPEPQKPRMPTRFPDDELIIGALRSLAALPPDEKDGKPCPRVVPFTTEAASAIQAWREELAQLELSASGMFLSWLGKLPGTAVRLATIATFLTWALDIMQPEPEVIGREMVEASISFLREYAMPMARRSLGEAALPQIDRDVIALGRWIQNQDPVPETINPRDLRNAPALPTKEYGRYQKAIAELVEAGWCRPRPSRTSGHGRQRADFEINPILRGASE